LNGEDAPVRNQVENNGLIKDWRKWAIALTVSFGTLLQIIDVSIVNVSLPQMQGNLGATLTEIGWVVTGYAVANAIVIPLTAWLGDYFGEKAYFITCLVGFVLASVLCGFATSLPMLLAARVLQGLLGGGLAPRAQAIMFETFGPKEIGVAQSIFGIGIIVGPTFGPTLGGYLTDTLGWRWVFFINVPIGIIAILMAMAFLQPSKGKPKSKSSIDWIGIILLATWLGSFQTFLEEGEGNGWFESDFIVSLVGITIIGLVLFVWRELTIPRPAVDLRVLRYKALTAGSIYAIALGISLFGTIFVIPIFTQRVLGFTAVQTGMILIPGALASAVLMPVVGRLMGVIDARVAIGFGSAMVGLSMYMLSFINIDTNVYTIFWPLIIRGAGMGFMFIPLSIATLGAIPRKDIPAASGFFNLTRQMGGSIGVAMLATILEQRQVFHYGRLAENISMYNPTATQFVSQVQAAMMAIGYDSITAQNMSLSITQQYTQLQAMVLAFEDVYVVVAWIFVCTIPLIFFLGKGAKATRPGG
jgi:MFS transporter, DHA2 family, multidrug resistance protein